MCSLEVVTNICSVSFMFTYKLIGNDLCNILCKYVYYNYLAGFHCKCCIIPNTKLCQTIVTVDRYAAQIVHENINTLKRQN